MNDFMEIDLYTFYDALVASSRSLREIFSLALLVLCDSLRGNDWRVLHILHFTPSLFAVFANFA